MNMVVKTAEKEAVVTDCIPLRTEWLLNAKLILSLVLGGTNQSDRNAGAAGSAYRHTNSSSSAPSMIAD